MSTRDEAIAVLSERMNQDASTQEASAHFCSQFVIRQYKDGWIFQTQASGKGQASPLWWMVVGSGAFPFYFFKMANPGAYLKAKELDFQHHQLRG